MGFTKRELVEFFDSLTALVSEENRKEADFQIQVFMDRFEKSYPYETAVRAENEVSYHPSTYVAAMPASMQHEIMKDVMAHLRETGNYSPQNMECAMNSKLCDLEGLLDIGKYTGKLGQTQKKIQERNRDGRR